jgi:hypothetical protein
VTYTVRRQAVARGCGNGKLVCDGRLTARNKEAEESAGLGAIARQALVKIQQNGKTVCAIIISFFELQEPTAYKYQSKLRL